MSLRQKMVFASGVAVSLGCLGLALQEVRIPAVRRALQSASPGFGFFILTAYGLFFWLRAARWRMLLGPVCRVRSGALVPSILVGAMANNLLPAHLGEFVRVRLFSRQFHLRQAPVLATLVLERVFDFLTILLLTGLLLLTGRQTPPELVTAGWFIGAVALGATTAVIVYVRWTEQVLGWFARLPMGLGGRVREQIRRGGEGLNALRCPRAVAGVVVFSAFQWGLMGGCAYAAVCALGIHAPLSAGFAALALTVAGLTLPSAPGFFGTFELCFALALKPYDVPADRAFAAAVFYHAITYTSVTLCGLGLLRRAGFSLRQVAGGAGP